MNKKAELYGLTVFKADNAIKELYSARADNMVAKADMYSKISKYGYVYLDELQTDITKNQTLNTINTYLLGAGIKSDLVSDDSTKAKELLKKQIADSELKKMGNIVKEESEITNVNPIENMTMNYMNYHIKYNDNDNIVKSLSNFHPNDIYVSSDYHLFDELLKNDKDGAIENVRKILNGYNSKMDENKAFIFLGDVCHKDIAEPMYDKIKDIMNSLKASLKIMVRGIDDDNLSIEKYKEMGFDYVVDSFEYNGIVFTHKPIPFGKDIYLNMHGHIHSSRKYYNMKSEGHIDVYVHDPAHNHSPMNIPDLIKLYNKGNYLGITVFEPDLHYYEEGFSMFQDKYMYIALTEEEVQRGYIDYELSEECNGKYVSLSLEGLESFIEHQCISDYKYYTKLPLNKDDIKIMDNSFTDSAILKLPFARDIENYKELNIKERCEHQ